LPHSCILLSRATGSRTIVHYRDLPEYPASAFASLDLTPFRWIHFEGRAVEELGAMLERARGSGATVSLEVEKPREGIESLFGLPDLLLFSRVYARSRGFDDPQRFLQSVPPAGKAAFLAWGADGGWCREAGGALYHVAAPGVEVVDSIGAGDVFNAGVIHGRLQGWPPERTLAAAVELASAKCARQGFAGLEEVPLG
jgi:ketohexokinase